MSHDLVMFGKPPLPFNLIGIAVRSSSVYWFNILFRKPEGSLFVLSQVSFKLISLQF